MISSHKSSVLSIMVVKPLQKACKTDVPDLARILYNFFFFCFFHNLTKITQPSTIMPVISLKDVDWVQVLCKMFTRTFTKLEKIHLKV